jgi:hypothetical protein
MPQTLETKKILIVVRTYPSPSMRGVEVSCTAGITEQQEWIRLFPVPYRFLDPDQRFAKYQWVSAIVSRGNDHRKESRKLKTDSVQILSEPLSTAHHWQARKDLVFPMRSNSLCELARKRDAERHPTLGFFKPAKITRFVLEADTRAWTRAQLQALGQGQLFGEKPATDLEKVPFKAKYEFVCDEPSCRGHSLMCTDWEMGQAWRSWRDRYGDDGWEQMFRQRFETEMIQEKDTHFFVGTVAEHPHRWIIVGLFYPPNAAELPLLEGLD